MIVLVSLVMLAQAQPKEVAPVNDTCPPGYVLVAASRPARIVCLLREPQGSGQSDKVQAK